MYLWLSHRYLEAKYATKVHFVFMVDLKKGEKVTNSYTKCSQIIILSVWSRG
jgi:hypothetical protein